MVNFPNGRALLICSLLYGLTRHRNLFWKYSLGTSSHANTNESCHLFLFFFQTCEIKAVGGKRFLTLHKVKLDQAGEVLYQACNAVTTAILTVKGTGRQN